VVRWATYTHLSLPLHTFFPSSLLHLAWPLPYLVNLLFTVVCALAHCLRAGAGGGMAKYEGGRDLAGALGVDAAIAGTCLLAFHLPSRLSITARHGCAASPCLLCNIFCWLHAPLPALAASTCDLYHRTCIVLRPSERRAVVACVWPVFTALCRPSIGHATARRVPDARISCCVSVWYRRSGTSACLLRWA